MSFLINYIYDFWNPSEVNNLKENYNYHVDENIEDDCYLIDKKFLITKELLEEINLKPPIDIIPNPSRNMPPIDKVNLKCLNKAQLNIIMSVKLKPIPKIEKTQIYIPRHPVLKEMLEKTKIKY
jgi:hypothetical protein